MRFSVRFRGDGRVESPLVAEIEDDTVLGDIPDVAEDLRKDRPYLIVIAGTQVGEMIPLTGTTVLGRGADADVRIVEEKLSRKHCRIVLEEGGTYIEDLESSNGTYVNGSRIDRRQLNDGDKIQVGETTILKFTYHDRLEERFQQQMYDSALRDGLTNVFNKKYFEDRIRSEVAFALRHQAPLSLILFDIDHFKKINDTRGHLAGDRVLVSIAQHVSQVVRTEDILARYGGEEFAVLCRQTHARNAEILAERIRNSIQQLPITFETHRISVTVSAGVAMIPDPAIPDVFTFIRLTDEALYKAKNGGRNRVVVHQPG